MHIKILLLFSAALGFGVACSRSGGAIDLYMDTDSFDAEVEIFVPDVADREELVAIPSALDFGNLQPGEQSCLDFTVRNDGNLTSQIAGAEIRGDGFVWPSEPVVRDLAPEASFDLTVCAQPEEEGVFAGQVVIVGDTGDLVTLRLYVESHTPDEPCLAAVPASFDFGGQVVGSFNQETVRLENCSRSSEVTLTFIEVRDSTSISAERIPLPLILDVVDGLPYTLTFTPEDERDYEAAIVFETETLTTTLHVTGQGIAEPWAAPLPLLSSNIAG